ncbi:MAG: ABC transporter permease [Alphaproteobacteria bacterium]
MLQSLYPALIVAYRQFLSWRTNWRTFLLLRLLEPMIFFYGIGIGFGKFVNDMQGVPYMTFLLPGSVCMTAMFSGLFEGTHNAYSRAYMQRTWFSFLATPTRIHHILAGELGFHNFKMLISATLLICAGLIVGVKLAPVGTLLAIPFVLLTTTSVAAVGYLYMSFVKSMGDFDYMWALVMTPMMVFSGAMVDVSVYPEVIQGLAHIMPLYHGLQIVRPLMLGTADFSQVALHGTILVAITVLCLWLAHHRLTRAILA